MTKIYSHKLLCMGFIKVAGVSSVGVSYVLIKCIENEISAMCTGSIC